MRLQEEAERKAKQAQKNVRLLSRSRVEWSWEAPPCLHGLRFMAFQRRLCLPLCCQVLPVKPDAEAFGDVAFVGVPAYCVILIAHVRLER